MHEYLSTACLHELHGRCIRTCKFCDTPCTCDCGHDGHPPHNHLAERIMAAMHEKDPDMPFSDLALIAETVVKVLRDTPRSGDAGVA